MRATVSFRAFRSLRSLCVLGALGALGCGDDTEEKKPPTYSTMKPPPQGWKAAVGDGGTLLETFDDASWEVRRITEHDLFAVSCIDNEVGWAVGEGGNILHTEDGGWSWPAQASGVTSTLRAVSFAFAADDDAQVGLAVGDDGALVTTQDGGEHWTFAHTTSATLRGTAITEGASLLLAVGDGGIVARSTTRGAAFEVSHVPGAADFFDVALDASGGLALAVDSAGSIWVSHDQAKTFEREHTASGALEGVALGRSGQVGSAAGSGLALLRSSEGVWRSVPMAEPTQETALNSLQLHATLIGPHEDRAYFAGDDGALLETVDGGKSLFRVRADTHATLRGIEDLEAR